MSTKTFNISMPDKLVEQIDQHSRLQGSNRSDFIRQAVRKQLTAVEQWQTSTKVTRAEYGGKKLSEKQVADVVRAEREKQN